MLLCEENDLFGPRKVLQSHDFQTYTKTYPMPASVNHVQRGDQTPGPDNNPDIPNPEVVHPLAKLHTDNSQSIIGQF